MEKPQRPMNEPKDEKIMEKSNNSMANDPTFQEVDKNTCKQCWKKFKTVGHLKSMRMRIAN